MAMSRNSWDVIVVGGGHAGCEAASASHKMGLRTLMVTLAPGRIGVMSCNPAIGGLAKGQLVKEIDALGGVMGMNTDKTAIQYRTLNLSKGPAVRSSRAQCDKPLYALKMQEYLRSLSGLQVLKAEVSALIIEKNQITGIRLQDGSELLTRSVVVTSGTFLQAVMHVGENQTTGGRHGDAAANDLSGQLSSLGFRLRRLKTGTPPRLHKNSIDFSELEPQPGDVSPKPFSFYYRGKRFPELNQVNCFITHTNQEVHDIIEKNITLSPMYTGAITGAGPRYCPSIEDKVKRFIDKDRHQIFLEPEGLSVDEVYVNGVSTSLPRDVQDQFIRKIKGLGRAEFIRYGYAVEYDAVDARQLRSTLESKDIGGLYFAGQVNGTSGYEEAGAQGLVAGMNASLRAKGGGEFVLGRDEAYIGVLVDDLVLKGSDEPYRMFTSRAEHRLFLREDNADLRLSEKAFELGLLSSQEFQMFLEKKAAIESGKKQIDEFFIFPTEKVNGWLSERAMSGLKDRVSGAVFLRRPEVSWPELCELGFQGQDFSSEVREQVEIQTKYEGYIRRDLDLMESVRKQGGLKIPLQLNYSEVPGLSNEIKGKLRETRPENIGQAARIQGVTPAAVANLMIFLRMQKGLSGENESGVR